MLSVYGVYYGLAVVYPESPLKGGRIGRVQLQWQIRNALKLLCKAGQHLCLIYAGKAGVYIQRMGALLLLKYALTQYQVVIPFRQRLFHAGLAGGVYALADKLCIAAKVQRLSV